MDNKKKDNDGCVGGIILFGLLMFFIIFLLPPLSWVAEHWRIYWLGH